MSAFKMVRFFILSGTLLLNYYSSAQNEIKHPFSFSVKYEYHRMIKEYGTRDGVFKKEDGDKHPFFEAYNVESPKRSDASDFLGIQTNYSLAKLLSINAGIGLLLNECYTKSIAEIHPDIILKYRANYFVHGYSGSYLRIPLGCELNTDKSHINFWSLGVKANFDFLFSEKIWYPTTYLPERIFLVKNKLFLFDRIVPSANVGFHTTLFKKFVIDSSLGFVFRSVYQHAHTFFYYKNYNASLGVGITYILP